MLIASLEIPLVDFRGHAATNGVRQSRQTDADPDTHVLDVWNLKRSIADDMPAANLRRAAAARPCSYSRIIRVSEYRFRPFKLTPIGQSRSGHAELIGV